MHIKSLLCLHIKDYGILESDWSMRCFHGGPATPLLTLPPQLLRLAGYFPIPPAPHKPLSHMHSPICSIQISQQLQISPGSLTSIISSSEGRMADAEHCKERLERKFPCSHWPFSVLIKSMNWVNNCNLFATMNQGFIRVESRCTSGLHGPGDKLVSTGQLYLCSFPLHLLKAYSSRQTQCPLLLKFTGPLSHLIQPPPLHTAHP